MSSAPLPLLPLHMALICSTGGGRSEGPTSGGADWCPNLSAPVQSVVLVRKPARSGAGRRQWGPGPSTAAASFFFLSSASAAGLFPP